jgi:hypothetical protein
MRPASSDRLAEVLPLLLLVACGTPESPTTGPDAALLDSPAHSLSAECFEGKCVAGSPTV